MAKSKDDVKSAEFELQRNQLEIQKQQAKNIELAINKIAPIAEKYFVTKLEKLEAPRFRWTAIIFGILLGIIVIGVMCLVYAGKVGADNLVFLLGIIVGYMITLMREVVLGFE